MQPGESSSSRGCIWIAHKVLAIDVIDDRSGIADELMVADSEPDGLNRNSDGGDYCIRNSIPG